MRPEAAVAPAGGVPHDGGSIRMLRAWLISVGGLLCWTQASLSPAAPLTNITQVRALSAASARAAQPVQLEAIVLTPADPPERAVIVHDGTAGLYVLAEQNLFSALPRGERLRITGVSDPGEFAPIVKATAVTRLGPAPMPMPRPASYQELITGASDAQWVELTGVVRRYLPPEPGSEVWRILLAANGGVLSIRVIGPHDPQITEDAEVRVRAVCLYQFNQRRQVLTPVLQVPQGEQPEVLRPAPKDPFAAPIQTADSLLQFSPENPKGHRVHVRGIVTHAQLGRQIWLRDATAGLRVLARQPDALRPGDEIEVLGFPGYGNLVPLLEDAIFRIVGRQAPPAALQLRTPEQAYQHEDDLVSLTARLLEAQPVADGVAFTFDSEGTIFKGLLKQTNSEPARPAWEAGSVIRVQGICALQHDELRPMMGVWRPQSFQLLLRSPADLEVLQHPPWWNAKRLTYLMIALLAGLLCAAASLIWRTRRRLKEQAQRRAMAEAEFSAILAERNRVAREIHDTLAQGLAATSVHLRLAKKLADSDPAALLHHLEASQELVRDSLEEARNSIWNMRSQVLETGDLAGALRDILKHMSEGTELKTDFQLTGRPRRLAPVLENNLLRIGQEAITNATKHSRARHLTVRLDYHERWLELRVRDDGCGFDPQQPAPRHGSFGLLGLRERAAELKAELHLTSNPGQGTEVHLRVPLTGSETS